MEYSYDTSEELDEDGNVLKESEHKESVNLGLKPIPLAVLALTACKYLINKLEEKEII